MAYDRVGLYDKNIKISMLDRLLDDVVELHLHPEPTNFIEEVNTLDIDSEGNDVELYESIDLDPDETLDSSETIYKGDVPPEELE